jgi:hypothetical protein
MLLRLACFDHKPVAGGRIEGRRMRGDGRRRADDGNPKLEGRKLKIAIRIGRLRISGFDSRFQISRYRSVGSTINTQPHQIANSNLPVICEL